MKLEPFAMERLQSTYENQVDFNLSESGVHPLTLGELVDDPARARRAARREPALHADRTARCRCASSIAAHLSGRDADHVQVTNGGAEANYITTWNLVEPGDEVVMMVPNYMQTWGLARAFGATVKEWPLVATPTARGGACDADALERLVSPRTKLIVICNPNNPTGARFEAGDLDRIAAIAARHGSWILSDEIYRGAERDGRETPTMWGRSDRVIVTSGLSKAYGLPGLRIGWIVGPPSLIASLWSYHDYTTIAPGALSDALARRALEPARRARILARTRGILNAELSGHRRSWLDAHGGLFSYAPPDAGAIVYVRYHHAINSTELVTRLRVEKSVLVVPGDHFGMDGYLRIGFGDETATSAARRRLWIASAQRLSIAESGLRTADARIRSSGHGPSRRDVRPDPDRLRQRRAPLRRRCSHERRTTLAATIDLTPRIVGIATRHGHAFSARDRCGCASASTLERSATGPSTPRVPPTTRSTGARVAAARAAASSSSRRRRSTSRAANRRSRTSGPRSPAARTSSRRTRDRSRSPTARSRARPTRADRRFLFEGAVMDGVPIFNLVRETLPAVDDPRLSRRREQHDELHPHRDGTGTAVRRRRWRRCRRAGIAEADASLDVDGWDAAAKTAALANVLLGANITPQAGRAARASRRTRGRRAIEARARRPAAEAGRARGREGPRVTARVAPEELPGDDLLAGLEGQQNALILQTDLLERNRDRAAQRQPDADRLRAALRSGHDRAGRLEPCAPLGDRRRERGGVEALTTRSPKTVTGNGAQSTRDQLVVRAVVFVDVVRRERHACS